MEEIGVIRDLEIDEVKNYVLLPNRGPKDVVVDGKYVKSDTEQVTVSWHLHEWGKREKHSDIKSWLLEDYSDKEILQEMGRRKLVEKITMKG